MNTNQNDVAALVAFSAVLEMKPAFNKMQSKNRVNSRMDIVTVNILGKILRFLYSNATQKTLSVNDKEFKNNSIIIILPSEGLYIRADLLKSISFIVSLKKSPDKRE